MPEEISEQPKKKRKGSEIAVISVAAVLLVIVVVLLALIMTLVIKGAVNPDYPPDIFGVAPLAVSSDSMNGDEEDSFRQGDLIFIKVLDDEGRQELEIGDVVCYKSGDVFVTHRIVALTANADGDIVQITTRGDNKATNTSNDTPVMVSTVFGIYVGKIGGLGSFALFLQTGAGIATIVAVAVLAIVIYEVCMYMSRRKKKEAVTVNEKDAEIERLRALLESGRVGDDNGAAEGTDAGGDAGGDAGTGGNTEDTENKGGEFGDKA